MINRLPGAGRVFVAAVLCAISAPAPMAFGQEGARNLTTGREIFRAACAGCHGGDGKGAPDTQVGFQKPETFPDFTACDQTTPEREVDWRATIQQGGHGRG